MIAEGHQIFFDRYEWTEGGRDNRVLFSRKVKKVTLPYETIIFTQIKTRWWKTMESGKDNREWLRDFQGCGPRMCGTTEESGLV